MREDQRGHVLALGVTRFTEIIRMGPHISAQVTAAEEARMRAGGIAAAACILVRDAYICAKGNRIGARMNKYVDESSRQTAKMNRQRLSPLEPPAVLEEIDKKAADVRANMARLREQRLAREAQEVRAEIATPAKPKPKKRFR